MGWGCCNFASVIKSCFLKRSRLRLVGARFLHSPAPGALIRRLPPSISASAMVKPVTLRRSHSCCNALRDGGSNTE